ncbi:hypothetical protein CL633_02675 [bacterium]|nr:hypothetical protein [bacterium]|tara:strand:- start:847 stop:1425 length:579 start_codon:yes stop_codon:yes gene_type:complete
MLTKFSLGIAMLFLVLLVVGCGEEAVSPVSSVKDNAPLTLIIDQDDNGQVFASSINGQIYTVEDLQEIIKLAAQDGRSLNILQKQQKLFKDLNNHIAVQLAPPNDPFTRIYISDITLVSGGVRITLTDIGILYGLIWNYADDLADMCIDEYPGLSAHEFQITLEIYYHCWLDYYFGPSDRFRTVNITFGSYP